MPPSRLALLPLAGHEVDRDSASRSRPALFDELWAQDPTRVLPLWQGRTLVQADSSGLALLGVDAVPSALLRVYLGRTLRSRGDVPQGSAVVAAVLGDNDARDLEPDESRWKELREIAGQLDTLDQGLFTEALGITNWHTAHAYCPRCGMPTVVEQGGWVRRCFEDGLESFPRTDAAVIVGIADDEDRLLLGSNAAWAENRYSLLAGFVEPGESFEAAVRREMWEEAALRLGRLDYLGSQPWPFPASIMVGYRARLADGVSPDTATPDATEIRHLRWFSRSELREEDAAGRVILPSGSSIARAIVEHWLAEEQ